MGHFTFSGLPHSPAAGRDGVLSATRLGTPVRSGSPRLPRRPPGPRAEDRDHRRRRSSTTTGCCWPPSAEPLLDIRRSGRGIPPSAPDSSARLDSRASGLGGQRWLITSRAGWDPVSRSRPLSPMASTQRQGELHPSGRAAAPPRPHCGFRLPNFLLPASRRARRPAPLRRPPHRIAAGTAPVAFGRPHRRRWEHFTRSVLTPCGAAPAPPPRRRGSGGDTYPAGRRHHRSTPRAPTRRLRGGRRPPPRSSSSTADARQRRQLRVRH